MKDVASSTYSQSEYSAMNTLNNDSEILDVIVQNYDKSYRYMDDDLQCRQVKPDESLAIQPPEFVQYLTE